MNIESIKDPKLRARVEAALRAADGLRGDLKADGVSGHPPAIKTPPRRIRQSRKPLLNKLEQEYYDTHSHKYYGNGLQVQCVRFRLANGLWYKPDFTFFPTEGKFPPLALEVKGPFAHRGGFENLKMAAHQYPWIKWILVWKENREWQEQVVLP